MSKKKRLNVSRPLSRWPSPEEFIRFLEFVAIGDIPANFDTPCWIYNGFTDHKGYGQFPIRWLRGMGAPVFVSRIPPCVR